MSSMKKSESNTEGIFFAFIINSPHILGKNWIDYCDSESDNCKPNPFP